jgi:acyl-CoA oxidase
MIPRKYHILNQNSNLLKVFAFFESIICDGSTNVKLSVHYNLFGACLAHLGTKKHHDKYWSTFEKGDQLGCFLMSELAHASNLRQLGTTVTLDEMTRDFVVNTPDDASQKYWVILYNEALILFRLEMPS